jgi:hypothetical protein
MAKVKKDDTLIRITDHSSFQNENREWAGITRHFLGMNGKHPWAQ